MEININFKPVMMRKKNSRRGFLKKMSLSSIASVSAGTLLAAPDETPSAPSTLQKFSYDLMVYGASSGGVIAAYTAKMYGLRVLLVEPGRHLGGLSAGGLGATDTGGKGDVITGLAKEFYFRVGKFYGKEKPVYVFEPHVAELIFNQYVNEAQLDVFYSRRVKSVRVQRRSIKQVTLESEDPTIPLMLIDADCFIDASYEGDLLAKAGVSYTVGHESNATYNEKYNGVVLSRLDGSYNGPTLRTSEFPVPIDPYVIPGKPSSGLLPEINGIGHEPTGTKMCSLTASGCALRRTKTTSSLSLARKNTTRLDMNCWYGCFRKNPGHNSEKGMALSSAQCRMGKQTGTITDWLDFLPIILEEVEITRMPTTPCERKSGRTTSTIRKGFFGFLPPTNGSHFTSERK
jgi:hypothetical protein